MRRDAESRSGGSGRGCGEPAAGSRLGGAPLRDGRRRRSAGARFGKAEEEEVRAPGGGGGLCFLRKEVFGLMEM